MNKKATKILWTDNLEHYKREKKICKIINSIYTSLESHSLTPYYSKKKYTQDDIKFHKQCVQEYAELIKLVSELY